MKTNDRKWIGGSARRFTFSGKSGAFKKHVLSLKKSDLDQLEVSDKGYVKIAYIEKEKDQYGNEGSLFEDDYASYKKVEEAKENAKNSSSDVVMPKSKNSSEDKLPWEE